MLLWYSFNDIPKFVSQIYWYSHTAMTLSKSARKTYRGGGRSKLLLAYYIGNIDTYVYRGGGRPKPLSPIEESVKGPFGVLPHLLFYTSCNWSIKKKFTFLWIIHSASYTLVLWASPIVFQLYTRLILQIIYTSPPPFALSRLSRVDDARMEE